MTTAEQMNSTEFPRAKKLDSYVTNPIHGGKVTCYKCGGFIKVGENHIPFLDHQHPSEYPKAHFHEDCFNPYEHYYGIDKPIDFD